MADKSKNSKNNKKGDIIHQHMYWQLVGVMVSDIIFLLFFAVFEVPFITRHH